MKRLSMAMTALAVMGLMTMFSCNRPNVWNNYPGLPRTVTFNAATENGNGSKTYIDVLDVMWSAGDELNINGETFTLSSGENTTSGRFTGTITGSAPYLAGYPQASTTYTADPKSLKLNLQAQYTYDDTKVEIPMVATTDSEDGVLSFRNAVNVLKLELTGDGTTASNLTSIVLQSSTSAINGDIAVTFSDATPTFGYADGTRTTKVNFEGGKQLTSAEQYVYVVLPKINGGDLTIKFNCSNGNYMKKKITVTPDFNAVNNILRTPELKVEAQTTPVAAPNVTTNDVCYTCIYMGASGTVTPSEAQECEYGLVYAKTDDNEEPTIGGAYCKTFPCGTGEVTSTGVTFNADLDLENGVVYSFRAYAIGDNGNVVYGEVKTITAPQPVGWTNGESPKVFTVGKGNDGLAGTSDDVKVRFSQGNLQYVGSASTPYWKFADHQFDFLGETTGQNSSDQNKDRDLFGWGTSGVKDYTPIATCVDPWSTSTDDKHYCAYGSIEMNLFSKDPAKADWGYNAISNGGNTTNSGWRTLTRDELAYLLSSTNTDKWACGKVGSCTPGMIILPDIWTLPSGCSFTGGVKNFTTNVYTYTQWHDMEEAGAVFLPAAGSRDGTTLKKQGEKGYYWASTFTNFGSDLCADLLIFGYTGSIYEVETNSAVPRYYGRSVRLVR